MQEIDLLSADEVEKRLEKFRETIPGKKENANTFEMLALYQKTLGILGYSIPIDGRF